MASKEEHMKGKVISFRVEGWAYDPRTGGFGLVTSTGDKVWVGPTVILVSSDVNFLTHISAS
jgi:hypothetical protein